MTKWTDYIKEWAAENGVSYGCALSNPVVSAGYRKLNPKKTTVKRKVVKEKVVEEKVEEKVDYSKETVKARNKRQKEEEARRKRKVEAEFNERVLRNLKGVKVKDFIYRGITFKKEIDGERVYDEEGLLLGVIINGTIDEWNNLIEVYRNR
tara:strand:+ start:58 stop:510 length:453 start_codon:yes stop_codon:yes gene_type:complete